MTAGFVFLACACAASLILASMLFLLVRDSMDDAVRGTAIVVAIVSGLAVVAALITAASLVTLHFDQHCHALGGVLSSYGDCFKPHSLISA